MASKKTRAKQMLAKGLAITLHPRDPFLELAGRGLPLGSVDNTDSTFVEEQPTVSGLFATLVPRRRQVLHYLSSLFPFLQWLVRYNGRWLVGDLVAGITVGAVVVPQGMAYAGLAGLDPQFGLYSSFVGVLIYWFFATSKDITIGPVAVLSQLTGEIVADVVAQLPRYKDREHVIASAAALLAGSVVLLIGLVRCGCIMDLVSLTTLSVYMTGSAFSIAVGQLPTLMNVSVPSARDTTALVLLHFLKGLPRAGRPDTAMGLSALAMLYLIRSACSVAARRWPAKQRLFFFVSTLRTSFVILLYTLLSWLLNRPISSAKQARFKIVGAVPRGFQFAALPELDKSLASALASHLPAMVIIMLIEHMAIAKSFGRVNNYTINASQEMVAIGVTNLLAPFLGGYAATGSFSRTAIKSKAGVRTPLAGLITAAVVLLAIYALTAVFFYIPKASLSAIIIHAVGDLITPPNTIYCMWRVSPAEVVVFFIGVVVVVFSSIEDGVYTAMAISIAMLLFRILRARGRFLGRIKVRSVVVDNLFGHGGNKGGGPYATSGSARRDDAQQRPVRNLFLPIDHDDGSNPQVAPESPCPGIFVYRFAEGLSFPNAGHALEHLVHYIKTHSRRTNEALYDSPGDRPWNDPGPSPRQLRHGLADNSTLPTLKAIILDFSSVNYVDVTSVQQLIDARNQLDEHTTPDAVDWHVACIANRWTKRALVSAGFGYPTPRADGRLRSRRNIFSAAEIGGADADEPAQKKAKDPEPAPSDQSSRRSVELATNETTAKSAVLTTTAPASTTKQAWVAVREVAVHGLNRPLFHVDLTSALESAMANLEWRDEAVANSNQPRPYEGGRDQVASSS